MSSHFTSGHVIHRVVSFHFILFCDFFSHILSFYSVLFHLTSFHFFFSVLDGISNDLAYGALVGHNQTQEEGYLLRIVDRNFHDPPVLVAWQHMNYSATWVNTSDIFIKSYQCRSEISGEFIK